jgi:hypothetical protein
LNSSSETGSRRFYSCAVAMDQLECVSCEMYIPLDSTIVEV